MRCLIRRRLMLPVLSLMLLALPMTARAEGGGNDPIDSIPQRKALHFSLSALSTAAILKGGKLFKKDVSFAEAFLATAAVVGVGYYKERQDQAKGGVMSQRDLAIDAAGSLFGVMLEW